MSYINNWYVVAVLRDFLVASLASLEGKDFSSSSNERKNSFYVAQKVTPVGTVGGGGRRGNGRGNAGAGSHYLLRFEFR